MKSTLEAYVLEMEYKGLSPTIIKQATFAINKFIEAVGDINIGSIEPTTIKQYVVKCKATNKPSTINTRLRFLNGFFNFAVEEDIIEVSPMDKVKLVKSGREVIKTYSVQEVNAMIDSFKGKDYISVRNRTIVMLLADTGIRLAELTSIKLEDLYGDYLRVLGKGNAKRLIPLSVTLQRQIKRYLRSRSTFIHVEKDWLFLSQYRSKLSPNPVQYMLRAIDVPTDVPKNPHNFRRYFASQLMQNKVDVYAISRVLGHSNLSVTTRYIENTSDEAIMELVRSNSPLS